MGAPVEISNLEKYENYRRQKSQLKKALANEFFYEAIFIEYAIMEDRLEAALRHGGAKLINSRGNPLTISEKINKLSSNATFTVPYIRKRLSLELLESVKCWKRKRDALIHALLKQTFSAESLQEVALQGDALIKELDSKIRSVEKYLDNFRVK